MNIASMPKDLLGYFIAGAIIIVFAAKISGML